MQRTLTTGGKHEADHETGKDMINADSIGVEDFPQELIDKQVR